MVAKSLALDAFAQLALRSWINGLQQVAEMAGAPGRVAELVHGGTTIEQARTLLLNARAIELHDAEPLAYVGQALADLTDETTGAERTDLPTTGRPEEPNAAAERQARRYAKEVHGWCALVGMSEKAMDFIMAGTPVFRVRRELLAAQAARSSENHVCNLHNPGAAVAQPLPDAARIYRRRALAMGQQPA